jgi:hypothetical protein
MSSADDSEFEPQCDSSATSSSYASEPKKGTKKRTRRKKNEEASRSRRGKLTKRGSKGGKKKKRRTVSPARRKSSTRREPARRKPARRSARKRSRSVSESESDSEEEPAPRRPSKSRTPSAKKGPRKSVALVACLLSFLICRDKIFFLLGGGGQPGNMSIFYKRHKTTQKIIPSAPRFSHKDSDYVQGWGQQTLAETAFEKVSKSGFRDKKFDNLLSIYQSDWSIDAIFKLDKNSSVDATVVRNWLLLLFSSAVRGRPAVSCSR